MKNTFWIGANIIFDLETGATRQVLMLVNREFDATSFEEKEANTILAFVKQRAAHITWSLDKPTAQRPQGYLIRGVQITSGG